MSISIEGRELTKRYAGRAVFSNLSFDIEPGSITAILGPNGSGKSTLLKILALVLEPTKGKCNWIESGQLKKTDTPEQHRGYVAPYLELYDDLTALEHMQFVSNVRGMKFERESSARLLMGFGLAEEVIESGKLLRAFSSGMRQRVRFGMAAVGDPELLFLDEPTSNLDADGIRLLFEYLQRQSRSGKTIVIATNEPREIEIATKSITLSSKA